MAANLPGGKPTYDLYRCQSVHNDTDFRDKPKLLNTGEKFNAAHRVAQAIADIISSCGMRTFNRQMTVLQDLLQYCRRTCSCGRA